MAWPGPPPTRLPTRVTAIPDLIGLCRGLLVIKRPIDVVARFATADGTCKTLEGNVRYQAGDPILTGTRGEQWPVRRDFFLTSYDPIPPTIPGTDGLYRKRPTPVHALRLTQPLSVPVGWQDDPLQGRPGDWLLRYDDGSHGVVQDTIFRETYEPAPGETRWPPPP